MKKLTIFLTLVTALTVKAQSFEGTIRWAMSMEFSDPALQAKMAAAQEQMNDPEVQAAIKELEAKMKDPETKKMMEQNPQIKAAMESAMKSAQRGGAPEGMDNMVPKGMTMKVRGASMSTIIEGGVMDGMEMLMREGQPAVRINRKDQTYSKLPEGKPGADTKVTATKTSETTKILGYTCAKYVVQMTAEGQTVNQIMWTTTEIKDVDMKSFARQRNAQGQPMFSERVEGFPLKIEVANPQGKMIMEVAEIKREKLSSDDLTVPAGFKEK